LSAGGGRLPTCEVMFWVKTLAIAVCSVYIMGSSNSFHTFYVSDGKINPNNRSQV